MHEDLDVANFSRCRVQLQLVLEVEADFADQDETRGELATHWSGDGDHEGDGDARTLAFGYRAAHAYDHQGERGTATLHRGLELRIDDATSLPERRERLKDLVLSALPGR